MHLAGFSDLTPAVSFRGGINKWTADAEPTGMYLRRLLNSGHSFLSIYFSRHCNVLCDEVRYKHSISTLNGDIALIYD